MTDIGTVVEVGKTYKLRNGLTTTSKVRLSHNGTSYIYEADVMGAHYDNTPSVLSWNKHGKFLGNFVDHRLDIII